MLIYKAFILFVSLSTAYALKCYVCLPTDSQPCTTTVDCSLLGPTFDRCASVKADGKVIKSCLNSADCKSPISCCRGDLCNGAIPTGPSVILLLLTSTIFSLFL